LFGLMIVVPRAASWMTARDLATVLNASGTLPSHVSVLNERVGSLIFYLSPPLREAATADRVDEATIAEAIWRIRVQPADAAIAVRNDDLPRFTRLFTTPPTAEAQAGTFTLFRVGVLRHSLGGE